MVHSRASRRLSEKSRTLGELCWYSFEGANPNFLSSHSFGSMLTYALVNMYPTISDGIVLTGFSTNASFVGYFAAGSNFEQANLNQPFRLGNVSLSSVESILNMYNLNLGNVSLSSVESILNMYSLTDFVAGLSSSQRLNYPAGYLTNANIGANQYLFFLPGFFDPGLLLVGENTKQPVTVGELLTLSSLPMTNAYAGPVLIITGCKCLQYNPCCQRLRMLTSFQPTTCHIVVATALLPVTLLFPQSQQRPP